MPRPLTLLLLVALSAVAFGSTGCGRCGETGTFRDHCDGDTRHLCDGRRVKRQKCGSGSTCREVPPETFPYTECVDDSLTPCDETTCSGDASTILGCGDSGYLQTRVCAEDEVCMPFNSFSAGRLKYTDETCEPPEGACSDDGQQVGENDRGDTEFQISTRRHSWERQGERGVTRVIRDSVADKRFEPGLPLEVRQAVAV